MTYGAASSARGLRVTRLQLVGGGWLLSFTSAETDIFAEALAAVRRLPVADRYWDATERAWWIAAAALLDLCELLPDVTDALAKWRGRTHSKAGQRIRQGPQGQTDGETRTGQRRSAVSKHIPAAAVDAYRGVPADVGEAFATIHLLLSPPADLVKWAQRLTAKRAHPDVGGSHKRVLTINLAAEQAQLWAEAHDQPAPSGAA